VIVDASKIASLRALGCSWAQITDEIGVSKGTAQRALVAFSPEDCLSLIAHDGKMSAPRSLTRFSTVFTAITLKIPVVSRWGDFELGRKWGCPQLCVGWLVKRVSEESYERGVVGREVLRCVEVVAEN